MHFFQIIMVMCTTSLVLITALFLTVRRMPSQPGIEWWIGASLALSIASILSYLFFGGKIDIAGESVYFILQLSATYGLSVGTLLFIGKEINFKHRLYMFSLAAITSILCLFLEQLLLSKLIFAAYNSANMLHVFLKLKPEIKNRENMRVANIFFLLIGLHWLDYPFLRDIEWIAPAGYLLGVFLWIGICLSLASLALFQFEKQTKESEQKAIYAANHDSLTDLYNRSYLDELFSGYAIEAAQTQRSFALLYLDLDGFKVVNDTYGHQAGDVLLHVIAKRLTNFLKTKGDAIRIGGDELVVLARLRASCKTDNVHGLGRKILNIIEQPVADGDQTYYVSASIGICCYPLHGSNLNQMIRRADKLMYSAKQAGGKRIHFADLSKTGNPYQSTKEDIKETENV